jgi:hypothetical protein
MENKLHPRRVNDKYKFHDFEIKNILFDSINNIVIISVSLNELNFDIELIKCNYFSFQTDHIQNVIDCIYFDTAINLKEEIMYFDLWNIIKIHDDDMIFLITPSSGVILFAKCEDIIY